MGNKPLHRALLLVDMLKVSRIRHKLEAIKKKAKNQISAIWIQRKEVKNPLEVAAQGAL